MVFTASFPRGPSADEASTFVVDETTPAVQTLRITGGPFFTNKLQVFASHYQNRMLPLPQDPSTNLDMIQWFYRKNGDLTYSPIVGSTTSSFQPTHEFLHGTIRIKYTPVREDGLVGRAVTVEVPSTFLAMDPMIQSNIDNIVVKQTAKEYLYPVVLLGSAKDHSGILALTSKELNFRPKASSALSSLSSSSSSSFSLKLTSPDLRVSNHPFDLSRLLIRVARRPAIEIALESFVERETVVLVVAAFQRKYNINPDSI